MLLRSIGVACAICFLASSGSAQSTRDEQAIDAIVNGFATAWNTPGMPGLEKLFAPDADFVVVSGHWHKGRQDIVTYHRSLLQRGYNGSRLTPTKIDVRFVRPDVAIAHAAWHADYRDARGAPAARTALMTIVLTKDDGRWEIEAAHNTLTGGPGYGFGANPMPAPPAPSAAH
jgi:uncharacterized protein (TIGR02246 family)